MTCAYWCVLIAALLPYVWTGVAKQAGQRYDNRDPRAWLTRQDNPRVQRANAAQLNAFEAFPAFAAGVLMAQFAGVETTLVTMLAVAFIVLRVLHGLCYLGGLARARSAVWLGGIVCVITLMVQAALHIGT
ncbi:MAG: MAPEG family protein [Luteimonas sp.]